MEGISNIEQGITNDEVRRAGAVHNGRGNSWGGTAFSRKQGRHIGLPLHLGGIPAFWNCLFRLTRLASFSRISLLYANDGLPRAY